MRKLPVRPTMHLLLLLLAGGLAQASSLRRASFAVCPGYAAVQEAVYEAEEAAARVPALAERAAAAAWAFYGTECAQAQVQTPEFQALVRRRVNAQWSIVPERSAVWHLAAVGQINAAWEPWALLCV